MRLKYLPLALGIGFAVMVDSMGVALAQDGYGSEGGSESSPAPQVAREFEVKHADGTTETGNYQRVLKYYLAPGWAKPRRMSGGGGYGGGGYTGFSTRSGQSKQPTAFAGAPGVSAGVSAGGSNVQSFPTGGLYIDAVVTEKAAGDEHAKVIVGRISRIGGMGAAMGSMMPGGMGGEMGVSMGMGSMDMGNYGGGTEGSMGGYGGMMGGYGGGMEGAVGGYGEMMGGGTGGYPGAGGMAGMPGGGMPDGRLVIVPLEEIKFAKSGPPTGNAHFSVAQLKNLAELVRVDCRIEEELETLRSVRKDAADKFKDAESNLKELLSKEYQLQLDKQREDIQRLAEKLKALEVELSRRAAAQERVVDVQLGQLILEAQGLLGERP